MDADELIREPLAYIDRHGTFIAPWPLTYRLARQVAEVYAPDVLAYVAREEHKLRDQAVHGDTVEWSRTESFWVPPERYAENLHKREPVFALVREWCGHNEVEHFDEIQSLRAEVARLRELLLSAVKKLDEAGRHHLARRIERELEPGNGPVRRRSRA
jgi:hypothetical protein